MKLKLTHNEFIFLFSLLGKMSMVTGIEPLSSEGLQHSILQQVYQKFYSKAIFKKKKYGVTLKVHECQMWWLWFQENEFADASFEGNLLRKINYSIHQQFQTIEL